MNGREGKKGMHTLAWRSTTFSFDLLSGLGNFCLQDPRDKLWTKIATNYPNLGAIIAKQLLKRRDMLSHTDSTFS